jgi:hypothetical protein
MVINKDRVNSKLHIKLQINLKNNTSWTPPKQNIVCYYSTKSYDFEGFLAIF